MTGKMFPFVTKTWSPLRVKRCPYGCRYCWANHLRDGKLKKVYDEFFNTPVTEDGVNIQKLPAMALIPGHPTFKPGDVVFVQTMSDLFEPSVSTTFIAKIMEIVKAHPKTDFLFLTKNPHRYLVLRQQHPTFFSNNVIFGVTIESNENYPGISKAPLQTERLEHTRILAGVVGRVFISIEPVMEFEFFEFTEALKAIKPWKVAVGFDNYHNGLREPSCAKVKRLIDELERIIGKDNVVRKSLRGIFFEDIPIPKGDGST